MLSGLKEFGLNDCFFASNKETLCRQQKGTDKGTRLLTTNFGLAQPRKAKCIKDRCSHMMSTQSPIQDNRKTTGKLKLHVLKLNDRMSLHLRSQSRRLLRLLQLSMEKNS